MSEEQLKEKFEPYGEIEQVKKIKDYGFIHFKDQDDAVKAMEELNNMVIKIVVMLCISLFKALCYLVMC